LKTHILQLLKARNAEAIAVTDPGGKNVPCEGGKAKQTFAATGKDLPERQQATLRSMLLGTVNRLGPYKVINANDINQPIRVTNNSAKTLLVLDSSADGVYTVSGETECLKIS
jgi:hypothetical protein